MSESKYLNEECTICFDTIGSDDYLTLPNCLHRFHLKCLDEWENKNSKNINPKENKFPLCPVCQYPYNETLLFKIENKSVIQPDNKSLMKADNTILFKNTKSKHQCVCQIS